MRASRRCSSHGDVSATPPAARGARRRSLAQDALPAAAHAPRMERLDRRATRCARARRHASRRHGVLDVQLRLHRAAERCRAPASRCAIHVADRTARGVLGSARRRRRVLAAEDLLRVRLRQLDHVPVRGRRHQLCCCPAGRSPKPSSQRSSAMRPTVLFGLPTLYVAMAALAGSESRDLSSLRLCLSAAETLSSELFNEWQRRYGLAIVEGLGSTEVLHIYLSNSPSQQEPAAAASAVPITSSPHRSRRPRRCRRRIWQPVGARGFAGAVLLASPRQDRGNDARRLDLHWRPVSARRRRIPLLRGPRRRSSRSAGSGCCRSRWSAASPSARWCASRRAGAGGCESADHARRIRGAAGCAARRRWHDR